LKDAFSATALFSSAGSSNALHHLLTGLTRRFHCPRHAEALNNRQRQRKRISTVVPAPLLAADLHAAAKRLHITAHNVQADTRPESSETLSAVENSRLKDKV